MNSKSTPTIVLIGNKYDFKKLLGVSLLERNIKFLSYYGFKEINLKCNADNVKYLKNFIENNLIHKEINSRIIINSVENSLITINNNEVYNYHAINLEDVQNFLGSINGRKITTIRSDVDFSSASNSLFKSIDKDRAESIFFFTNFVNRPVGKILTLFFLKFKISPNFISILSLLIAIVGSIYLMKGHYIDSIIGILLFQLSASLDCADGPVARLKYLGTSFGGWLDSIFDKVVKFILYLSMGVGLYILSDEVIYLYGSMALLFGNSMTHLVDFTYKINFDSIQKEISLLDKSLTLKNILNSDLNILGFACLAIAFNIQNIYLFTLAIYFNFLWIYKIYKKYSIKNYIK
jgi:phosphatidylglycerophosphate synthase